jgi:ATP-binding cassette subfamily B protein
MLKVIKRLPIGACAVAITFLLVQIVCALWLPLVTADIINQGVMAQDIDYIWSKGYVMIALSAAAMLGAIFNTLMFSQISYRLGGELRADIYRKVLSFAKFEFDAFGTSSLITRSTNDVTQVQTLVESGLKFLIMAPAMFIGGIIMTFLLSPTLGLVFLCSVPFFVVAYLVVYRFASPLYERMQRALDRLNQYFREGLTGVKVIRAFMKEDAEFAKYQAVNQEYTSSFITAGTIMSVALPLVTVIISLATIVIVWVGGWGVAAGDIEVGSIMSTIAYSAQILMGFGMLTNVIFGVPRGQISAKRINAVLDTPLSITDKEGDAEGVRSGVSVGDAEGVRHAATTLAFEHVDFRYRGAQRKTLEDISFAIGSGATLAIIGSTGDGKSSLVNLIPRLYDVESGRVCVNGVDVRDIEQAALRDMVSFVPQKSTLFFGTVRSNLLLAKPNATDEELWAALDSAQATEFIRTQEAGLDSVVEKDGGNFSGGQKQRLCIARALLKDAHIYIFDDSFSALDFKTDSAIRAALGERLKDAITIIVAQRIGTVMGADAIMVLDGGKLAGLGTHDELKESNAIYQEIIDSQYHREGVAA